MFGYLTLVLVIFADPGGTPIMFIGVFKNKKKTGTEVPNYSVAKTTLVTIIFSFFVISHSFSLCSL